MWMGFLGDVSNKRNALCVCVFFHVFHLENMITEWIWFFWAPFLQTTPFVWRVVAIEQEQEVRKAKRNPLQRRYANIDYMFFVFFSNPWFEQFGIVLSLLHAENPPANPAGIWLTMCFFLRVMWLLYQMTLLVFGLSNFCSSNFDGWNVSTPFSWWWNP